MSLPDRQWQTMDEQTIRDADCSDWICVLPLGAHEQHGPHLPFDTDTIIANGVAKQLAERLDPHLPVSFLPAEPVGYSVEHVDFEGSKTLAFDEAVERWTGIGEHLAGLGIRKMLLLNAHGGNSPLMTVVATELRVRCSMFCIATSWTRFIEPGETVSADEKAFGIHGGDIETSVLLALAPDKVDMDKAKDFPSFQMELAEKYSYLRAYGPHAFGWKMQDLNADGVTGNASLATAAKGKALIEQSVKGLSLLLREINNFEPPW